MQVLSVALPPEKLLVMDSLEGVFTVENDIFYRIGEYKAIQREKKAVVTSLLKKTDFSIARIADIVGVTQYYVKKVKKSLN